MAHDAGNNGILVKMDADEVIVRPPTVFFGRAELRLDVRNRTWVYNSGLPVFGRGVSGGFDQISHLYLFDVVAQRQLTYSHYDKVHRIYLVWKTPQRLTGLISQSEVFLYESGSTEAAQLQMSRLSDLLHVPIAPDRSAPQ